MVRLDEEKEDQHENKGEMQPAPVAQALFKARTVMIFGEIDMKLAERVTGQLLAFAQESEEDIRVIVNSPGGHVESGDTIHDVIKFVGPKVKMIGTGWVASAGAHIYLGAAKERRFCLPNTRFLLHQPAGGTRGMAADIEIEAKEIIRMRERLVRIISEETGQPIDRINKDIHRNHWMTADEAIDYGMVTSVIRDPRDIPRE